MLPTTQKNRDVHEKNVSVPAGTLNLSFKSQLSPSNVVTLTLTLKGKIGSEWEKETVCGRVFASTGTPNLAFKSEL